MILTKKELVQLLKFSTMPDEQQLKVEFIRTELQEKAAKVLEEMEKLEKAEIKAKAKVKAEVKAKAKTKRKSPTVEVPFETLPKLVRSGAEERLKKICNASYFKDGNMDLYVHKDLKEQVEETLFDLAQDLGHPIVQIRKANTKICKKVPAFRFVVKFTNKDEAKARALAHDLRTVLDLRSTAHSAIRKMLGAIE